MRNTSRDLPEPTEEWPTPGWYDDESLFWLVRGVELREDYEDHYTHVINAGQRQWAVLVISLGLLGYAVAMFVAAFGEVRPRRPHRATS